MYDLIVSGGILAILYILFIRGYFFRGILWICGCCWLNDFLYTHIHPLTYAPMNIFDRPIPWSIIISFSITLAAIITTKVKKQGE